MKKTVKHATLILLLFLFVSGSLLMFLFYKSDFPKSKKLLNRDAQHQLTGTLFYGNASLDAIKAFTLSSKGLAINHESYQSYTEGFLTQVHQQQLLEHINAYRKSQGLLPISYFYQYIQDDRYAFISLSEGLNTLYIINLKTYEVKTPHFDCSEAKDRQYIYHIQKGQDVYYVLSAVANSYEAHLYALDPSNDFSLHPLLSYTTAPSAISSNQYALDAQGRAYFVAERAIDVVNLEGTLSLDLPFSPSYLLYEHDTLYALGLSEHTLYYQSFNASLEKLTSGELSLPNRGVSFVDGFIEEDLLYTLTFDASHPLYRNYITVYDLKTHRMGYCLALYSYKDMAPLALQK